MTDRPQSHPPSDSLTSLVKAERDAAFCRLKSLLSRLQHGATLP